MGKRREKTAMQRNKEQQKYEFFHPPQRLEDSEAILENRYSVDKQGTHVLVFGINRMGVQNKKMSNIKRPPHEKPMTN